jgi:hypothetical protein
VQRPAVALDRGGQINVIAFGSSPTRLYGYNNRNTEFGFRRMTVDASGVSIQDVVSNLITGYDADIVFDGGRIYSSSGRVIDPEARTLLGTFPQIGERALVVPDSAAGRVFFLTGEGPARVLTAYDAQTFLPLGSLTIPGLSGRAGSLLRWGRDGLAFRTEGGQVFLIRTALAR